MYLPDFVLGMLMSIASNLAINHVTDSEYHSFALMELTKHIEEISSSWSKPLLWIQRAWSWGEFILLLTNRKRRAIHDFIAGTVVVHASSKAKPEPAVIDPLLLNLQSMSQSPNYRSALDTGSVFPHILTALGPA